MELRIATCRPLPEPDPDEAPLLAELAARGVAARMAAWDDPKEPWDAPVATIVRSTWDYLHRLDEFLAWVDRVGRAAPLWNPPDVLRQNVHKFYLRELQQRGVPIVPTAFVERGASTTLADVLAERGWTDAVVKPAVSAASFGTVLVRGAAGAAELARGEAHLAALLAERDVLVQRYAPAVETSGERALVWIDGAVTHCVRKSPRFEGGHESVSAALQPEADERELAERLLAPLGGPPLCGPSGGSSLGSSGETSRDHLLYGRVDLVRDEHGRPQVMELELLEPSLFLVQHRPALTRLVDGLVARLRRS